MIAYCWASWIVCLQSEVFLVGSDPASQTLIVHEVFMIKTHTHVYAYIYVYTCVSLYFPL